MKLRPMLSISASILLICVSSVVRADETLPNILWINAEDMSPHLGCYGHPDGNTPNIDRLAAEGVVFRNAFATAPICSPARSCLATGLYATSLGTQHLRCEVEIPDVIVPLASRLRKLGYYCTNTGKTDYNFNPKGIWDALNSSAAPWRARKPGQPFFAFITVGETHEGRINFPDRYDQATAELPDELRHDPSKVTIPPFYPETPEIRKIFAGMYDLATVFDRKVGEIIKWLNDDGDFDDTIVFVFGDHGNGLPRYKRWLNDSGLRVPLVVYVPTKFRTLSPYTTGSQTERLVSFVDFPATAMSIAGVDVPAPMQGMPFMGKSVSDERRFVFGARSRADDMFEVSRSVFDGRYLYIRHFLPHLPYVQPSVIFDDRKASFRELRKLFHAGQLNHHASRMWAVTKPLEELYDIKSDPHELTNLATSKEHTKTKQSLAKELSRWILEHRDSGFLPEAEYQIRAAELHATPFEIIQDREHFDLPSTLEAALRVGDVSVSLNDVVAGLQHKESGVRYWSAVALQARDDLDSQAVQILVESLTDPSPSVRIAAAEALLDSTTAGAEEKQNALVTLGNVVQDNRPWVSLQAARAIALQGERASALISTMKRVVENNRSKPGSRPPYKDFNYASFTGWALESALLACGEVEYVNSISNNTNSKNKN